jgi:aryl-alcohol dehydrogenase-like predicted oxidoreductase
MTLVQKTQFGRLGMQSRLAFGAMTMSGAYTADGKPLHDAGVLKVFETLVELGVTHIDTAQAYGWGHNEQLVGRAIKNLGRDKFFIATKFGFVMNPETRAIGGMNSSPENIRKVCNDSLNYLGIDCIDLFYQHRPDPKVEIEVVVRQLKELIDEGKIKAYGLSEAPPDLIRRAHKIHPVGAVQSELSVWVQDPLTNGVLETCRELNIPFVAFSPLGRGLLAGANLKGMAKTDFRQGIPRFTGDNLDKNLKLLEEFTAMARQRNCTPAQLSLAWCLAIPGVVPLFATRSPERLAENCASVQVKLTKAEFDEITHLWSQTAGSRMWQGYRSIKSSI